MTARDLELQRFISRAALFGTGIGYIDAHLPAAVKLTQEALLWSRDMRLVQAAKRLHLSPFEPGVLTD